MIQALLNKGAEVNAKDNKGVTALMLSGTRRHLPVQSSGPPGQQVNAKRRWSDRLILAQPMGIFQVQALLDKGGREVNAKPKMARPF